MAKLSIAVFATLVACSAAFAPAKTASIKSSLAATGYEATEVEVWDPLSLRTLGKGESFDTFPNMFPSVDYLMESEVKHGRQAMLAWTGVWATSQVSS